MLTEEIKIDLTEIGEKKSRDSVKQLIESRGIPYRELNNFWFHFERNENDIAENTIVFIDLHSLVKHKKTVNHDKWAFRVKKSNPYFISFIRNNKDEKLAGLIDDLVKECYNRLTVLNATHNFTISKQKKELLNEFQNIVSRNFNPDSIKSTSVNKRNNSFLVEFNDGYYGEITFDQLYLGDVIDDLLLDSVRINEKGNSIELFTKDGEIFDIDALVLKSFVSSETRKEIKYQTQLTAHNVGNHLKVARKDKNVTQKELSELTDIDQSIISKIETGKHLPRFDTLERIATGLKLSISDLLKIK